MNHTHPDVVDGTERRSEAQIIILSLVVILLFSMSLLGNLMVIVCIRCDHRLRKDTGNVFLTNLSLTDMVTASVVMISCIFFITTDAETAPYRWCAFICMMNYVLIIVSMLTLCFISLDRYIAVVHGLRYHTLVSKRKATMLIAYAWLQGLLFGLPPALVNWIEYDYWEMVCAINWATHATETTTYVLLAFLFCFMVPGIALIVAYCKVMSVAKRMREAPAPDVPSLGTMNESQSRSSLNQQGSSNEQRFSIEEQERNLRQGISAESHGQAFSVAIDSPLADVHRRTKVIFNGVCTISSANPSDCELRCEEIMASSKETVRCGTAVNYEEVKERREEEVERLEKVEAEGERGTVMGFFKRTCPVGLCSCKMAWSEVMKRTSITRSKAFESVSPRPRKLVRYSASRKAIQSLLIVVVAYFICMTPFCITKVYKVILQSKEALPGYVNVLATICQFCSSAINPLIYGIFRKDFRRAFHNLAKKVLCFHNGMDYWGQSGHTSGD